MAPTPALPYEPDVVLPPGETLNEVLGDITMTQTELAKRTGLSTKHINQIVNGAATITAETALLLERATGVTARVWSTLELAYREHVIRASEEANLADSLTWLDELPIKELAKRGHLTRPDRSVETLRNVLRFFGVANREAWDVLWQKPTAYRTSKAFRSDPGAVAAWLRIGEIEAGTRSSEPFDRNALTSMLDELRALTRDTDPHIWWPRLVQMCAAVGVIVVAEPEIKGARINGAARWLAPDKALVQLSLRHRWSDIFWFTFFHEIGHLLIHSKKDAFINEAEPHSGAELEADGFASQTLIPRRSEVQLGELETLDEVADFASSIGIAPGIVVGRLQHERRWPFSKGNGLRQRLAFSV